MVAANTDGIHQVGFESVRFLQSSDLSRRRGIELNVVQAVGGGVGSFVVHVGAKQAVLTGQLVVNASGEVVLRYYLLASERKYSYIAITQNLAVGQMPERQIGLSGQVHAIGIGSRPGGKACSRARVRRIPSGNGAQHTVAGGLGGNCGQSSNALRLAYAFVVGKEKGAVLHNGTANGAAKLIALERWNGAAIKIISGIEGAVAEKLISAAVEAIGPRAGDGVDNTAGGLAVIG